MNGTWIFAGPGRHEGFLDFIDFYGGLGSQQVLLLCFLCIAGALCFVHFL